MQGERPLLGCWRTFAPAARECSELEVSRRSGHKADKPNRHVRAENIFPQRTFWRIDCQMTDSPSIEPAPAPEAPDFTPVPGRARHDGWTAARQGDFLRLLATLGSVGAAARGVGMTPQSANRLRRRAGAESFAAAWDAALDEGRLRLFDRAVDRSLNGYRVPIRRAGRVTGHRQRFDNRLLFAVAYGAPASRFTRPPGAHEGARLPEPLEPSEAAERQRSPASRRPR